MSHLVAVCSIHYILCFDKGESHKFTLNIDFCDLIPKQVEKNRQNFQCNGRQRCFHIRHKPGYHRDCPKIRTAACDVTASSPRRTTVAQQCSCPVRYRRNRFRVPGHRERRGKENKLQCPFPVCWGWLTTTCVRGRSACILRKTALVTG